MTQHDELLEVLSCEIASRPKGAPTPNDLVAALTGVRRAQGSLVLEFRADAGPTVRAFADAERQCCSTMGWELSEGPDALALSISGTRAQIEAISTLWPAGAQGEGPE